MGDSNDDAGANEGGGGDGGNAGGNEPTFTPPKDQAEFDRMVSDRLRRERSKFSDYDELKAKAAKFDEAENASKSEIEKATSKASQAEQRAAAAETTSLKLEVALDKAPEGMSPAQIRKLAKRLSGSSREELEADADELFGDFAPSGDEGGQDEGGESKGGDDGQGSGRPKERLKPGSSNQEEPEEDPEKIAERIFSRNRI